MCPLDSGGFKHDQTFGLRPGGCHRASGCGLRHRLWTRGGRPGEYPYKAGMSVLDAITAAGGLTYRGSRWSVLVKHSYEIEWREYPLTAAINISLLPGDGIRIPERYF